MQHLHNIAMVLNGFVESCSPTIEHCFDLSCISKARICDTISDCPGAYREDEKDRCTPSQIMSSCEELWNVGHRSNGTYTIRVGSYGNGIRELILNGFEVAVFLLFVCLMVVNATFNNILVKSWRSGLLVEETGGPGDNHRPVASH